MFVRLALLKTKSEGRWGGRKDLGEEMLARRRTSRTGVGGGENIRERWRPGQPGCRPGKSDLRKITKIKISRDSESDEDKTEKRKAGSPVLDPTQQKRQKIEVNKNHLKIEN